MNFRDQNAIQIMKGYMANGTFGRGTESFNAEASMVFEGNINDSVANMLKTTHLFDPFPPEFNNDSAFFDRIHCYLPGWEIPKMRSDLICERYSLITDCLGEFLHAMRRRDFTHHIDRHFRLNSDFNRRDEIGVRKTFSGLAKLIFPDGKMDREDVRMLLEYAIEGRRRVKEQLKTMAGIEFIDVKLGYADVENPMETYVVGVLEQSDDSLIPRHRTAGGPRLWRGALDCRRDGRVQAREQGGEWQRRVQDGGRGVEPRGPRCPQRGVRAIQELRSPACGRHACDKQGLSALLQRPAGEGPLCGGVAGRVHRFMLCRIGPPRDGRTGDPPAS